MPDNDLQVAVTDVSKYVAVYAMPGCLPEMDPAYFEDASDAWKFLADELDRSIDDTLATYSPEVTEAEDARESMLSYARASDPVLGSVSAPDGYWYSVDLTEQYDAPDGSNLNDDPSTS